MFELNREYLNSKYEGRRLDDLAEIDVGFKNIISIDTNTFQGLDNLNRLELKSNAITEIKPTTFDSLSSLTVLKLYNNRLQRIGSSLFKSLINLETLNLSDNDINVIERESFKTLSNLKELYLYGNDLTQIDLNTFKGLTSLEKLHLQDNKISEIEEDSFVSLERLTELKLNNNKLEKIESNTFNGLEKLTVLWLHHNQIANIEDNSFMCLSNLEYLELNNNNLNREIDRKCFESLNSIRVIQLYENAFKFVSFFKKSPLHYLNQDELKKHGFQADWDTFLRQFIDKSRFEMPHHADLYDRYKVTNIIGKGTGIVYHVYDKIIKIDKAMKVIKNAGDMAKREFENMLKINHENVIKYYDHFDHKIDYIENTCIIMEYCENGDLERKINQRKHQNQKTMKPSFFEESEIFDWISQATNGLKYLHSNKIRMVHRNIKPANMLLTIDNVLKLSDLGIAKILKETVGRTYIGSPEYMSPEVEECEGCTKEEGKTYSFKTDVWSLGCVLYELINLSQAFPKGPSKNPIPSFIGYGRFKDILERMLVVNSDARIGSIQLYDLLKRTFSDLNVPMEV